MDSMVGNLNFYEKWSNKNYSEFFLDPASCSPAVQLVVQLPSRVVHLLFSVVQLPSRVVELPTGVIFVPSARQPGRQPKQTLDGSLRNSGGQVSNPGQQLNNTGQQVNNTGRLLRNPGRQLSHPGRQLNDKLDGS